MAHASDRPSKPPAATESISPRFGDLDRWPAREVLLALWEGQLAAVAAVHAALPAIAAAVEAALPLLAAGGRLVYVGAGTSGRIGVQDGAELPPTFDWPEDRLVLLMAGGERAFTHAIENAEDDRAAAQHDISAHAVGAGDVVIGIAASGSTPYTTAAVAAAAERGALTIGIANSAGGSLLAAAAHRVLVETGAEAIAGSTRLQAGTAQKVVLNLLSTLAMVRLGRIHRGLMVDMNARNAKLRQRARRMLRELTGADEAAIRAALDEAKGRVKVAVLVLRGLDRAGAESLLARHGGHLHAALDALPPMKALLAARLFDGQALRHDRAVLVEGTRIAGVVAPQAIPVGAERIVLPADHLLCPGFIDLQVNGGDGVLFGDSPDAATLDNRIAAAHAGAGTTALLPTLISGTRPQLAAALAATRAALASGMAGIAGLHLEGPFIAASRRGIHPAQAIATLADDDLALLAAPFPAPLLVTLAPEAVDAGQIRRLATAGVRVFAGHTDASYEAAIAAFDAGVAGVTHLYNAMSGFVPRAPGVVGASLDRAASFAGIIVDGRHVHDAAVRIAFAAKGPDALLLVSDAMPTAASAITEFVLNGERIRLDGGRLVNAAGVLAGAHLTLADAVRHAAGEVGLPLAAVLRMATRTPARAIGLADRGRIAARCIADFVVLDAGLNVAAVWQNGNRLR